MKRRSTNPVAGRMTPLQVCNFWQSTHRPLSESEKKAFLGREEISRIIKYSRFQVEDAIRRNHRLVDALKQLQLGNSQHSISQEEKRSSAQRRLREPTETEKMLWSRLINRQLDGYLFEREREILGWYVDFYCEEARLVVEVDGSSHRARRQIDAARDDVMRANGYNILRFTTIDVTKSLDLTVSNIRRQLPDKPGAKSRRRNRTAQRMPGEMPKTPGKAPRRSDSGDRWVGTISSDSRRRRPSVAPDQTILVKGPVHCAGCISTYIGTFRSASGLDKCRGCGNIPIALCRNCKKQIFGDEGSFCCKLCDPSVRAIAMDAAGPGAQHPTNNLRSARRGKRVR